MHVLVELILWSFSAFITSANIPSYGQTRFLLSVWPALIFLSTEVSPLKIELEEY